MSTATLTTARTLLYDPWEHVAELGIEVNATNLPGYMVAATDAKAIWIDKRLFTWEATNALAHEIVHWELGHSTAQPAWIERSVNALTVSRLYPDWLLERAPMETMCGRDVNAWLYEETGRQMTGGQLQDMAGLGGTGVWGDLRNCTKGFDGSCEHGRQYPKSSRTRDWLSLISGRLS
ncbi:hypothetical protein [Arthrobacter sp. BPSS-3]|uniref:hypothetical protein n=1 Tax=Arthrobacter sp. BPSS-3 TaxID=3366580 RepID=UPI0037DC0FA6